jgi:hypothetical protein
VPSSPLSGPGRRSAGGQQVNNFYATFNISNPDPQAVVNALRTYMQRNGTVPITTTG